MVNKIVDKAAKILAAAGALNWGLVEFVKFDLLSLAPAGIIHTLAVAAVAVSGGYVLYELYKKRI